MDNGGWYPTGVEGQEGGRESGIRFQRMEGPAVTQGSNPTTPFIIGRPYNLL